MTQDIRPSTDPLHMAATTPVNQAGLLSAVVVGAVATVAVDTGFFPRSQPVLASICVFGWVLAMGFTVVLIGRGQPQPESTGKLWHYLRDGWYRCTTNKRYAALLALMAGLAAYAVFVKLRESEGGVLANVFHALKDVQADTRTMGADLKVIRAGMETPAMLASRGGYPPTPFGAAEAVKADLAGLRLVQAAGVKIIAVETNPIGRLLEVKAANVADVLDSAGLAGTALDTPFPIRHVNGRSPVPDFSQLLSSLRIRIVPENDPIKAIDVMHVKSDNVAWAEQRGESVPLVQAVWLNRPDAVKALLERKAQPNATASFKMRLVERRRNTNPDSEAARASPYVLGSREAVLRVNALSEARRLRLRDIEGMLVAANARAEATIK